MVQNDLSVSKETKKKIKKLVEENDAILWLKCHWKNQSEKNEKNLRKPMRCSKNNARTYLKRNMNRKQEMIKSTAKLN